MKFKTKVIEIEAWRWDCGEPIPETLKQAIENGDLILPEVIHELLESPEVIDGTVYNSYHNAWIKVHLNDWIVYSSGLDDIYPCHETVFEKKYEGV